MSRMHFQQAGIPVQKESEFQQLKAAIERVFSPDRVAKFLKRLDKARIPVRHFEDALAGEHFDQVDEQLARSGRTALDLYEALTVSDQSLIREYYLTTLEHVDVSLRSKFREIYYCH
ncbi:MAG: hypothetical protein JO187_01755 [Acidobacteria bacterium]|nr:hypothetical protein [Acidobacteriota bacterium]